MSDATDRERSLDRQTFDAWPPSLRALFDGTSLTLKVGFTASLVFVDANGDIRTSLLGPGELYADDVRTLYVALWPQSRAARTFAQCKDTGGRASLSFVFDGAFYQLQLRMVPLLAVTGSMLACFAGTLEQGELQRVGYAHLTSGITFELGADRDAVLARWQTQIDWLKRAAGRA
ncbi:hypothetical protein [Paraburkholderia sp.]|uniref:hypothetical protein n=1 Tax=Paraburkholderia sp. TaxID=1926495 RepID=UPI003D6E12A5